MSANVKLSIFVLTFSCIILAASVSGDDSFEDRSCTIELSCTNRSSKEECCSENFCCNKIITKPDIDLDSCKICPASDTCCSYGNCCHEREDKNDSSVPWSRIIEYSSAAIVALAILYFALLNQKKNQNVSNADPSATNIHQENNNQISGPPLAYPANQQVYSENFQSNQQYSQFSNQSQFPPSYFQS